MKKKYIILGLIFIFLFSTVVYASLYPDVYVSSKDALEQAIKNHLGSWNLNDNYNRLDAIRLLSSDKTNDTLGIGFLVSDNLTLNMIKGGIERDIANLFKISVDNYKKITDYKDIKYVIVTGYFSVTDKYGDNSLGRVAAAATQVSELEKINWSNFFADDMPKICPVYEINLNGF